MNGAADGGGEFAAQRREMVERQIVARGVRSERVLAAMARVRREDYVPEHLRARAYEDEALPIEEGQSISQPFIVAYMLEAAELRGDERVLEIGTGSGYAAAVLSLLAFEVFTVERHEALARTAAARLRRDGCANVRVRCGDGTRGWPEEAPFDAIVVAAAGRVPAALELQLVLGGRLVIPAEESPREQRLLRIVRHGPHEWSCEKLIRVRFVPLV